MTTGAEIFARLGPLTGAAREAAIWSAVTSGEYPEAFDAPWPKVTLPTILIDGAPQSLTIQPAPDFFALGTNADPLYVLGPPGLGAKIAKRFDASLVTRKIARDVFRASAAKAPLAVPINDKANQPRNDTASWAESTARVLKSLGGSQFGTGKLVRGGGKSIVIGPDLDGSRVAIYGGLGGTTDGWAWQPYSTVHDAAYYDHSHRFEFVKRRAWLNGKQVDLVDDIAADKTLWPLVSDHGKPFPLSFPNKATFDGYTPYTKDPVPPKSPATKAVSSSSAGPFVVLGFLGLGLVIANR